MASQTLEQISETNFGQNIAQDRMYHTIDTYLIGTTVLYTDPKNLIKKDGTIETVLPKFVGNDTVKLYLNSLNGNLDAGYQKAGESHADYSNSGRMISLDKKSNS
jgi:hypothetical protein